MLVQSRKGWTNLLEKEWFQLSNEQVKKLKILDSDEVKKILHNRLRNQVDDLSNQEIYSAWSRIVIKAQKELDVNLVGPNPIDVEELRDVIIRLIWKSFPYNNNFSNTSETS